MPLPPPVTTASRPSMSMPVTPGCVERSSPFTLICDVVGSKANASTTTGVMVNAYPQRPATTLIGTNVELFESLGFGTGPLFRDKSREAGERLNRHHLWQVGQGEHPTIAVTDDRTEGVVDASPSKSAQDGEQWNTAEPDCFLT